MRRAAPALLVLAILALAHSAASADDDWRFRRTTPRGSLIAAADALRVGVPGGRAWGIESALRPLSGADPAISAELEVRDPRVREAFLRVAYYDRWARSDGGRPRQIAIADSSFAGAGERRRVTVVLDPPEGAVAYRVRVLARLLDGSLVSAADAVLVRALGPNAEASGRPSYTRLRPVAP